jgi:hypothetical protein
VPDRIDAAVERAEPLVRQAIDDRGPRHTADEKLLAGYHSVLDVGERRDAVVRVVFGVHMTP